MTGAMNAPIHSLFITLKRSFAGTREHHVRILQSLGFRYRQQTVEKPNAAHVRGAIDKASRHSEIALTGGGGVAAAAVVRPLAGRCPAFTPCLCSQRLPAPPVMLLPQVRHMLTVETDVQRATRLAAEAVARAPRPPVSVRH